MPATFTIVSSVTTGGLTRTVVDVTLSGSYVRGGYQFQPSDLGLSALTQVASSRSTNVGGVAYELNFENGKLVPRRVTGQKFWQLDVMKMSSVATRVCPADPNAALNLNWPGAERVGLGPEPAAGASMDGHVGRLEAVGQP